MSGTGSTPEFPGVDFPIPAGAQSVVIAFSCNGGEHFSVELGDSMALGQAPLSGTCDGTRSLTWPVSEQTGATLYVVVADGVDWMAAPTFLTAPFAYDEALTADCASFAEISSALFNADEGFTTYQAFGEDEWRARVDAASADLQELAEAAESELADEFSDLQGIVADPARTPGAWVAGTEGANAAIQQACNANQTPVVTVAEFGG
ncbi:hypothetical protein OB08_04005 [Microbacterium sp. HJ5]